jgi:endonuclease YncB( thermonuclease family)
VRASLAFVYLALIPHVLLSQRRDVVMQGVVVAVAEGDTLTLSVNGERVRLRLSGIDAPELDQPFGAQSRAALSTLTIGKRLECVEHERDRFGEPAMRCHLEKLDVGSEQVRQGMAWAYERYREDSAIRQLQQEAKLARRGLWAQSEPVAPWTWRHL